jgi:histidine triad (HIT) family protein
MDKCIFCKIVNKEILSHKVFENGKVLAFLDVKPHAKGHTVVIPKKHGVSAQDFTETEYLEVMTAAREVMSLLKVKLKADGFNVGWNDGSAAGQVVGHLHIHVMPRYNGDGGGSQHSIINNPGELSVEDVAKLLSN